VRVLATRPPGLGASVAQVAVLIGYS